MTVQVNISASKNSKIKEHCQQINMGTKNTSKEQYKLRTVQVKSSVSKGQCKLRTVQAKNSANKEQYKYSEIKIN